MTESSFYEYECTAKILADGDAKCSKYKSKNSGLTVCIAETDGPLVGGYLCVATEAHDDDGLPHTLEHLVFMGSEKYPYKGFLDLVASRCLSQGTNAFTAPDHTCYTITTAGAEGFLKLLPIYLDHVLYPTLKDSAFVTEVHHINGEGEDAGVVYCEMQTRENSGESRCYRAMLQSMYPGKCGYKSETGGIVKNLQESTTNEKVIAYHKEFYRPENLCIIVVGQIEAQEVFAALKSVEDRISSDSKRPPFVRPWQTPVPPLQDSILLDVEYPSDEEEYGLIIAAWRGPLVNDFSLLTSLQVLLSYLTDSSVAPLNRELVESDEPLCNQVTSSGCEFYETCIYLHLSNVPTKRLSEAKDKLLAVMKGIANGKEKLDMERMKTVIRMRKLNILSSMENSPHHALSTSLIGDFLYGNNFEDLQLRMREIPAIEQLFEEPPEFWINLLKQYITEAKHVIVLGKPSSHLSKVMADQEKQRIENQIKRLGPEGLKEKERILNEAVAISEIKPPKETLTAVSVPSLKSIKFHPIQRICNVLETEDKNVEFAIKKMPCRFQLDVIHTNFVRLYVLMDTSKLPEDLRLYLPLFVELLLECGINRDEEIIPYQQVVKELGEDTVSISANLGHSYSRFSCGKNAQLLSLVLMVEEEKYEKSVQWVREILYQIVFTPARIKSSINKMVSELADLKRDGTSILNTVIKNISYQRESNQWAASMMRQSQFLNRLLESNVDDVIEKLNLVREFVTCPERMTIHLSTNLKSLRKKVDPEQPWIENFLPTCATPGIIMNSPIKKCHELLQKNSNGFIIGVGSVETAYMIQCAPCLTSYTDPDYAPLLVLLQYLTQIEGPMWRQIRGLGLAYFYTMYIDPDSGMIFFVLYQSSDLVKGYEESLAIVNSHLNGTSKWESELFESATSGLVFETIEKVKTVANTTEESLKAYYSNTDMTFTQELLGKISQVTNADLDRVGEKYLKPLFDCSKSKCGVCCHPNKVDEIVNGFQQISRDLTKLSSLEDELLTKY